MHHQKLTDTIHRKKGLLTRPVVLKDGLLLRNMRIFRDIKILYGMYLGIIGFTGFVM